MRNSKHENLSKTTFDLGKAVGESLALKTVDSQISFLLDVSECNIYDGEVIGEILHGHYNN